MEIIAVIGAGFSGGVVARDLAQNGYRVEVFDNRPHVAGNCHTERDLVSNVMVHKYGPHLEQVLVDARAAMPAARRKSAALPQGQKVTA